MPAERPLQCGFQRPATGLPIISLRSTRLNLPISGRWLKAGRRWCKSERTSAEPGVESEP